MPGLEIQMRNAVILILLSASLSFLGLIWTRLASPGTGQESIQTDRPVATPDIGCILDPDGRPRCEPGS